MNRFYSIVGKTQKKLETGKVVRVLKHKVCDSENTFAHNKNSVYSEVFDIKNHTQIKSTWEGRESGNWEHIPCLQVAVGTLESETY